MRPFALRAAAGEDIEGIAAVWHDGWSDGHLGHVPEQLRAHRRLTDFRRLVASRVGTTTVAVVESRVAGFVTAHDDEVEQLYVARPARGTGVAAALLTHAEDTVASRSAAAWLAVVAGNSRARRFYARHGWQDTGPFDYHAQVDGGTMPVPARRYEKQLSRAATGVIVPERNWSVGSG
jgi:GNAT superfamily N-acetyltransferase